MGAQRQRERGAEARRGREREELQRFGDSLIKEGDEIVGTQRERRGRGGETELEGFGNQGRLGGGEGGRGAKTQREGRGEKERDGEIR